MSSARILQACPACRRPQALKNPKCRYCGQDFRKLKRKIYYVDYKDPQGKQRREKVGYSLTKAQDRVAALSTDLKRGLHYRDDILFGDLARMYMASEQTRALRSLTRIRQALDHLLPVFGAVPVFKITPDLINSYMARRVKEPSRKGITRAGTVNREVAYLRAVFSWGLQNEIISRYPFGRRRVKFYDERPAARTRYVTRTELDRLLVHSPAHLRPLLLTAYFTAMRRSEILKLTWDRIDLEQGIIELRPEDTKTKWGRVIPIDPELLGVLQELRQDMRHISGRVFLYRGQPISDFKRSFDAAKKKASIEDIWFHDLRGTATTNMLDATGDQKTTMAITGHRTASVFHRYVKVTPERLKAHIEKVAAWRKERKE